MVAGMLPAEALRGLAHVPLGLLHQGLDPADLLAQQAREPAAPAGTQYPSSCHSAHVRPVSAAAGRSLNALF
jgi:hypothetical protein